MQGIESIGDLALVTIILTRCAFLDTNLPAIYGWLAWSYDRRKLVADWVFWTAVVVLPGSQLCDQSWGFEFASDLAADIAGNRENEQRSAEDVSLTTITTITTITAITDEKLNGFFMRLSLHQTTSHFARRGD